MSSLELDRQSAVFERADPALVSHYVNEHIGPHRISVRRRSGPAAALRHRHWAALDLCQIQYGTRVHVTSPALEDIYHLQIVLHGQCQWIHAGQTQILVPGDLLLINPDEDVDLVYSKDCGKFVLKLPRTAIRQAAADKHMVVTGQELHFTRSRYRLADVQGLSGLLQLMLSESVSPTLSEQVKTHYARALCAKLIDYFPTNTVADDSSEAVSHFDRLVAFIDENLGSPLGVNTLARCAHMSPRSLYSVFRHHTGTSPMQFILRRKLERVHQQLVDRGTPDTSVTAIALDHGFSHLGRFSSQYRRQYGELPSETLRRGY